MFVHEMFREFLNHFQLVSQLNFQIVMDNRNLYDTRRSLKRLLTMTYSRTATKNESLKINLHEGYKWLIGMNLFSSNAVTLTEYQTKRNQLKTLFRPCTYTATRT